MAFIKIHHSCPMALIKECSLGQRHHGCPTASIRGSLGQMHQSCPSALIKERHLFGLLEGFHVLCLCLEFD